VGGAGDKVWRLCSGSVYYQLAEPHLYERLLTDNAGVESNATEEIERVSTISSFFYLFSFFFKKIRSRVTSPPPPPPPRERPEVCRGVCWRARVV
jgi:hypothetical protein